MVRGVLRAAGTGIAAGAAAGLLVGGVGGRAAMFALRHTSPDVVRGVTTDDGFVVGRFTTATIAFALVMAALGAVAGAAYAAARPLLAQRLRVPLWTLLGATVGGGAIVQDEGVDFRILEPSWFAVGAFIAIPALGACAMAVLTERWLGPGPVAPPPVRGAVPVVLAGAAALAAADLAATIGNLG